MEDSKRAIIEASSLPLSIIIVGVGQQDFAPMEELDSDNRLFLLYTVRKVLADFAVFD